MRGLILFLVIAAPFVADLHPISTDESASDNRWIFIGQAEEAQRQVCMQYAEPETLMLFFAERGEMGSYFYEIALHSGDIAPKITHDAFKRGISGAHYDVADVVAWANEIVLISKSDHPLVQLLLDEGFLRRVGPVLFPSDQYRHLVAVCEGRSRSLRQNIIHELLHVRYTRDVSFRAGIHERWKQLTEAQRVTFVDALRSYGKDDLNKLIEEWGVRQEEKRRLEPSPPTDP